jgi:predicted transglutaminase-like cysteine proteinase
MSIKALLTSLIIFSCNIGILTFGNSALAETLADRINFAEVEAKLEKITGYTIGDTNLGGRLPTRRGFLLSALKDIPVYTGANLNALLGIVNLAVNNRVGYSTDSVLWHRYDYWASPIETMAATFGDCEDFALLKYWLLLQAGVPAHLMRINIVRHYELGIHAVLGVENGNELILLDYRIDYLTTASETRELTPMFALTSSGSRMKWGNPDEAPAIRYNEAHYSIQTIMTRY